MNDNTECNIIINENEEDDFNLAYQQMINNDKLICGIVEDYNEIEFVTESKDIKIFTNNFASQKVSQETSKVSVRTKSVCGETNIVLDTLDIPVKFKSCKLLQHIN